MTDLSAARFAYVFPGQGAQFVGMGADLIAASAAARAVVAEADDALGFPLGDLIAAGPDDALEDTHNAQPALLTISVAALRAVEEAGLTAPPAMVAGHSLGEFSALVAAGAIDFASALTLVRERGRLMREAGTTSPGGMAAILGLDDAVLADICREAARETGGIVVVANANCPGQTVISGEVGPLERAMALAKERRAKRIARLNVSIASHSPLMREASDAFGLAVAAAPIVDPAVPVVANASAQPLLTAGAVREELSIQMERPVRWTESVQAMVAGGVTTFVELGPGNVLQGLIRRIDREATPLGIADLGLELPSLAK